MPADWYLDVKIMNKDLPSILTEGVLSGCSMFSIDSDAGTLQKNECKNVQVTFKPLNGVRFEKFILSVHITMYRYCKFSCREFSPLIYISKLPDLWRI